LDRALPGDRHRAQLFGVAVHRAAHVPRGERLQFFQSLGFALLSVPLLAGWRCDSTSVVLAFGVASLLAALGAVAWLRRFWPTEAKRNASSAARFLGQAHSLRHLGVVTNLVTNLFEVVDRYLIITTAACPP